MGSRCSESTKLTLGSISPLAALDIWLWPQDKHAVESERTSCFFKPPWQPLKVMIHAGPQCLALSTMFGRFLWAVKLISFSLFLCSPVCRIACHKKCEVKVRVQPFFFLKKSHPKTQSWKKLVFADFLWFYASGLSCLPQKNTGKASQLYLSLSGGHIML